MAPALAIFATPGPAGCCQGSYELKLSSTWRLEVVESEIRATCSTCEKRYRITVNIEALESVVELGGPENGNDGRPTARE